MGVKIEQFDIPVCNSFKPKIIRDQLCYEVEPQKYINTESDKEEMLKVGLTFLLDHNEDKEIIFDNSSVEENHLDIQKKGSLVGSFSDSINMEQTLIHIETIGI